MSVAMRKQHARHFRRKVDAKTWLDGSSVSVVRGDYVDPKTARITVEKWCETWLSGYATRRPGTVKMARRPTKPAIRRRDRSLRQMLRKQEPRYLKQSISQSLRTEDVQRLRAQRLRELAADMEGETSDGER